MPSVIVFSGSWKDVVSNNACMASGCPANSSTHVTGARSPEEMQCAWLVNRFAALALSIYLQIELAVVHVLYVEVM